MKFHGAFLALSLSGLTLADPLPASPVQAAAPVQAVPVQAAPVAAEGPQMAAPAGLSPTIAAPAKHEFPKTGFSALKPTPVTAPAKEAAKFSAAVSPAATPTDFSPTPENWVVTFPAERNSTIPLNIKGILTPEGSWHIPYFLARLGRMIETEQTWLANATTASQKSALQSELNTLNSLATQVIKAYPGYTTSSDPLDAIEMTGVKKAKDMLHNAVITATGGQMLRDTAFGQWNAQPNNTIFQQRSFAAQKALDYDNRMLDEYLGMAVRDGTIKIIEFKYFNQSKWEDLQAQAQDLNAIEAQIAATSKQVVPAQGVVKKPAANAAVVKKLPPAVKKAPVSKPAVVAAKILPPKSGNIKAPAPLAANNQPQGPTTMNTKVAIKSPAPALVKRSLTSAASSPTPIAAAAKPVGATTPTAAKQPQSKASEDTQSIQELQAERQIAADGFVTAVRDVFLALYPSDEGPASFITVDPDSGALPATFYSVYGSTGWDSI